MIEQTVLDKVYDPRSVEPEVFALWERSGAFRSHPTDPPTPHERTFTIVMPPPNVTGALHLGHALNNTLQDILIRYHRMRGFNTLWQPGTDHAGIGTQAVVERRIRTTEGKSRHDLGREELVRRIWQWKDEYEKRIIGQLKLMGCSCDWERCRFTLDEGLARAVRHQFFKMFQDGLIFRGKRLVNWDTQLQTAVSDDEVYYETVKGHFWHFKYPVIDPKSGEPPYVIIATTRPETMLGDTAVAVHPDPEGFFHKKESELKEQFDQLSSRSGKDAIEIRNKLEALAARRESHLPLLVKLRDMARDGRKLRLPLLEREIPLIADEWADPTLGSGCVKITPAHDPNDYDVGTRHQLPMINVLTPDGKVEKIIEVDGSLSPHSKEYEGLTFNSEGRAKVVSDMESRGLLEAVENRDTEIGHSDRSQQPIEPYLSDQWFVRTADPEPRALARADAGMSDEPRASARADLRSLDPSQGAKLVTWTTYGTWLPGDERGYVSRTPRADGSHELHNLPGEAYDADDPQVLGAATERMEGKPVRLNQEQARIVLSSAASACERNSIELLAVAVMANHVHILCQTDHAKSELLQFLKGNAARELNKLFKLEESPRWWTKSGSVRFVKKRSDLTAAIEYVLNQASPLILWSFDQTSGDAFEIVESARAEARGSIRLAQAAMEAVESGAIRVFPERYAKSYLDWLGEKRDWCISRQLWWGHRIPVWTKKCSFQEWVNDRTGPFSSALFLGDRLPVVVQVTLDGVNTFTISGAPDSAEQAVSVRDSVDKSQPLQWTVCCDEGIEEFGDWDESNRTFKRIAFDGWLESNGFVRDPDVLDTWFSSCLWPFSTLGWPEETPHLKQYYPGSVLCTSRDIITNWVARMVMSGLYLMGRVPFDHVYVHPKILDGRGETMSKSKGNGVDPVDIIQTHGADALRYSMADMTTESQDIRMPVEYICPHCGKRTDQGIAIKNEEQNRKSRGEKLERKLQPADCAKVKCSHKECGKEFATQWADADLKQKLGLGRETSEKFEIGRNFCNKLWNAARFAFMNLGAADFSPRGLADAKDDSTSARAEALGSFLPEDRWILARLSQTIRRYHECIATYQFAASVKELRDFFWDSLCDWYLELTKPRFSSADGADRGTAKLVLAFCLDQTLRLWHPTIPFITERLWQELNSVAPSRGLPPAVQLKTETPLISAEFPAVNGYPALDDEQILATFEALQDATRGVRELRSDCKVPPKDKVVVTVVVPSAQVESFRAHAHIVRHMAGIGELSVVTQGKRPANAGSVSIKGLRIYVHDVSDDAAERIRAAKTLEGVVKQISGKEAKLGNAQFVSNADPEIVAAERVRLDELLVQRASLSEHLAELKS